MSDSGKHELEGAQQGRVPSSKDPSPNPKCHTKAVIKNDAVQQRELYHNPDPLYCLIGSTNETMVLVEGQSFLALIDSGTTITEDLVEYLKLPIQALNRFLNIEGTRGIRVPYSGYMEMHLQVPSVKSFDRDVLLLVVPNSL